MNMIDALNTAEVDRNIAEGILSKSKRDERIARRRAKYSIAIARYAPQGVIGQGGVCIEPLTEVQVYMQYGSTPVQREQFEGLTIGYTLSFSRESRLGADGVEWVTRHIEALRRDLATDLRIDVKHSAARLNPELAQLAA